MSWPNIRIVIPPLPQTTTILALGFLLGCLGYTPMIAITGRFIQPEYRDTVELMASLFKDGMLLILGFYFAKVVNAGQQDMANRAIDAAVMPRAPQTVVVDQPSDQPIPVEEAKP